jgi:exonuclease III
MRDVLRVVSWNLAYWKPRGFNRVENRRRQWALLAALAPDIALLQECRPADRFDNAPAWMAPDYEHVGAIPPRWTACTAILARKPLTIVPIDPDVLSEAERRWFGYLAGYIAVAMVRGHGCEFAVASVHAVAREVTDMAVTTPEHERIRRVALARAWHNDLAVPAMIPFVTGRRFLVGGDWNNARLFDTVYPSGAEGGAGASTEFFERRRESGWCDAMRKFHENEVRTYFDPSSAHYELDHVFTDPDTYGELVACRVLDDVAITELSDHAPLVVEFAI